jgi:hypothetical protein
VPTRKNAPLLGAVMVRVITVVVSVVDAKAPVAELLEWALLLWVVGVCLIALEAVREGGRLTVLAFAQYKTLVAWHVIIVVFILQYYNLADCQIFFTLIFPYYFLLTFVWPSFCLPQACLVEL